MPREEIPNLSKPTQPFSKAELEEFQKILFGFEAFSHVLENDHETEWRIDLLYQPLVSELSEWWERFDNLIEAKGEPKGPVFAEDDQWKNMEIFYKKVRELAFRFKAQSLYDVMVAAERDGTLEPLKGLEGAKAKN